MDLYFTTVWQFFFFNKYLYEIKNTCQKAQTDFESEDIYNGLGKKTSQYNTTIMKVKQRHTVTGDLLKSIFKNIFYKQKFHMCP